MAKNGEIKAKGSFGAEQRFKTHSGSEYRDGGGWGGMGGVSDWREGSEK